jgi:hypothetical protein
MGVLVGRVIHPSVWQTVVGKLGSDGTEPVVSWQLGHERLLANANKRAELDADDALWLVVCAQLGAHRELGYGGLVEYVCCTLRCEAHAAKERIRVAKALVALPCIFDALAKGELSWSAVRELTRVAIAETEQEWLRACKNLRAEDVQRLVSGRRPGDLPTSPVDPSARKRAVRYEVSASTLALMRQAEDEHRRRTGQSLDHDVFLADLARAFLSSETEATSAASAQVMVTVCSSCRTGTADAGGETVPLAHSELERLCCDAEVLPTARTEPIVQSQSPLGLSTNPIARPVQPSPELMDEIDRRAGLKVATKLPDSIRDALLRRHHGKCAVPGCTNRSYLHVHHTTPRSEGGTHDPDALIVLCDAHHRAVHDGKLFIDGRWSTGFRFRHADGTPYGMQAGPDPHKADAVKVAFSVLRNLGFKEREARATVDAIRDRFEPSMSMQDIATMAVQAANGLPSQRRISHVREEMAVYLPSWAAA